MDIQTEIKKLLEAGMMYGGNTPEEKLTWLISELKNLSRVELPVKPANGGHLIIYQDIEIMQTGFCGLLAPYWKINLTDGTITASHDKKTWMPINIKLKIELE